ncbi:recombinase RecT, partial [Sutterella massiliensis]|nr:recombinase RecT [Sutterella massiliensis]
FCTVKIYRKSLSRPITISEYASEVFVPTNDVWRKYPRRMLRHKAIVQAARVAFSISGIYDRDDAMSIAANEDVVDVSAREVGTETAAAPERPHRTIAYKSRKELDGALDAAVKSALLRGDWTAAEK